MKVLQILKKNRISVVWTFPVSRRRKRDGPRARIGNKGNPVPGQRRLDRRFLRPRREPNHHHGPWPAAPLANFWPPRL